MINSVSYNEVLSQLRIFIRKYYLNKTLQGIILGILIFCAVLGLMILGSQGFKLNAEWRTVSFWVLAIGMAGMIGFLILLPFIQFIGVGRRLNTKSAERIISAHFGEMKDVMLNMLELVEEFKIEEDNSLLLASIEDKAARIKWYRFGKAVAFKKLLRFLPYIAGIFVIGSLVFFVWPDFVKDGYARTVNYKQDFDIPPVYNYKILNDSLLVTLGKDIEIRVEPLFDPGEENVYLRVGQNRETMEEEEDGTLICSLKAINAPVVFRLQFLGIVSEPYEIGVIPSPELVQFTVQYEPPAYTQIDGDILKNEGDLDLPLGTKVTWTINAMFTDWVHISFPSDTLNTIKRENIFAGQKRIMESGKYKIVLANNNTGERPELGFNIRLRPDLYPDMDVNEIKDSLFETQIFFQGFISDDYGFSRLEFIIEQMDGTELSTEELSINTRGTSMRFYHAKDMAEVGHEGEQLYYYFSVWDNDGVNGAKRTDSRKMSYRNLTYSELVEQNKERAGKIEDKIKEGLDVAELLKEKVNELKEAQLMEEKEDWEVKSKLKEMEEMQNLLDEMMNNIKEENLIKGIEQDKFDLGSERLLQKQEEIQDLLEKIMDDELRQLLKEFEELVDEANKAKQLEKLDEMDLNLEKLERQLDVSLELLKRYEIEKEVFRTANELEKLSQELENLNSLTDTTKMKEIEEEYDELNKNYEEQLEKNQELNEAMKMEEFDKEREDISDDMGKMNDEKSSKKNISQKQKSASKKMKELGEKMQNMMLGSSGEQDMVDLELLRQLTRELNDFSFKQEELIELVNRVTIVNPEYAKAGREERELKEKYSVIRDSLVSLGYKQPMIAKLLNKEMFHVETALENLLKSFQSERKRQLSIEQQNIMTGVNELAVRLDEMVKSLENQSSSSGGGKSSFTDSKPKSGKDKVGEMKKQQQSLKQQLQGMIQQMKRGKQGKPNNKALAKMLADREMLRRALEELQNSGELGETAKEKLNDVQKLMEEVEKDIIYKRLGDRTIKREKMIESKLLEAEQAEMERERENKREATEFRGTLKPPDEKVWKEFEQKKKRTLQLMKYRDIKLKEFYRKKYFDYLEQLEKEKK